VVKKNAWMIGHDRKIMSTTMKVFFIVMMMGGSFCHSPENKNEMDTAEPESVRMKTDSGYADVNGLKMYYEIRGTGEPLVLIHGGGSTIGTTFGRIMADLEKDHRVIAVEMQAHGHTDDIDRPLSFEQDADDIAALLKKLGIAKADIFGFSNGASTTLQFAIRHPEMTRKIIVASTMSKRSGSYPWFWEMMKNASFEEMPQPFKDAFLQINPSQEKLHRMYERDVARMRDFKDIPDESIKALTMPALIIAATNDVVSPEHALEMHRMIKNSQLVIVPGGHGEYLGEISMPYDPQFVSASAALINRFLKIKHIKEAG
jgi:pimeloyl-ACP methyl ester carboxylesterase